ncbi:hypothetical protein F5884DRAFT_346004 [Xylogone sp. PMI_703]|nr:hypothetical protein F5884DRAFT_346004 [Xylogone sp. PMI_703]
MCRTRKRKCDNARPACGFCVYSGWRCSYSDSEEPPPTRTNDPSNLVLLARINHAISILESNQSQGQTPCVTPSSSSSLNTGSVLATNKNISANSDFTNNGFGKLEVSSLAASTSACDSLFRWAGLEGLIPNSLTSLALQSELYYNTLCPGKECLHRSFTAQASTTNASIYEGDILALCRKFLDLIHVKNPVLDLNSFNRDSRHVADNGPDWSAASCLILLACALACLATEYIPGDISDINSRDEGLKQEPDWTTAEAYFAAGKKRLGLLPPCLSTVQCLYFAGLYEKFAIRPLDAWFLFQQACIQCQVYLHRRAIISPETNEADNRARHIEQRLYWSCVKAE